MNFRFWYIMQPVVWAILTLLQIAIHTRCRVLADHGARRVRGAGGDVRGPAAPGARRELHAGLQPGVHARIAKPPGLHLHVRYRRNAQQHPARHMRVRYGQPCRLQRPCPTLRYASSLDSLCIHQLCLYCRLHGGRPVERQHSGQELHIRRSAALRSDM
jgi:hypothetical protein